MEAAQSIAELKSVSDIEIPSMNEFIQQARLKVERANEHIIDLDTRLQRFSETDSYVIHVDYDVDAGYDFMRLETVETVPDHFLLIAGDALNNLRSSLDYVMFGLCPHAREFPIYGKREYFENAIKGTLKKTAEAYPAIMDFMLNAIQPYKGGYGESLVDLNSLNNIDKHRLLIARKQITFVFGIRAIDGDGAELAIPTWQIVHPLIAAEPIKGHKNVKITDKGKATCGIVFGDRMPLEGAYILASLREMAIFVAYTIGFIETNIGIGLR
jgi:hypothetical protein